MGLKSNHIEDQHPNSELSIQIHLSGLSFCVLNTDTKTVSYSNHFSFDKKETPHGVLKALEGHFENNTTLQQKFTRVDVIHNNNLSTWVAQPLFDENALADYLKFNAKILKSDFIAYDLISAHAMVNVYVPYVNINNFIYDRFGAFTYKHHATVLTEGILNLEKNKTTTRVYAHVGFRNFEIIVVQKGQLLLYNAFAFASDADFIYYLLFTFEQLKLNPETTRLILLGAITSTDSTYKMAYKYIRHIELLKEQSNNTEASTTPNINFKLLSRF